MGELTSANTDPYLIPFSTALSVDPLISGEYAFSNPSSSWSDKRRDSAYANMITWTGWTAARRPTVVFGENRVSTDQRCFPMTVCLSLSDMRRLVSDHD